MNIVLSYLKSLFAPRNSLTAEFGAACAKIEGLQKRGANGEYAYLRILDIANALRSELFSRGIVLFPHDREWWFDSWEQDGKRWTEAGIQTEITLSNGRESLSFASFGTGRDLDGKALSVAQTAALKSWLKRVGLIFGEWDDPEKDHGDVEQPLYPREVSRIAAYQQRAFQSALRECGVSEAQAEKIVSERLGQSVTADSIMQLPRKKFDLAIGILLGARDQTPDWQKSVEIAKQRKSQPIVSLLDQQNHDEQELGAD